MNERCPNCGEERSGKFCSACGQPRLDRSSLAFLSYIRSMIDTVADLDGSVVQTLKLLFTSPGSLTNEFLAGRSVSYIAPFKLFLIVSALYFIFGWRAGLELENFDHQISTVIKTYLTNYPKLQSDPAM